MTDYTELRAIIKAATKGPWRRGQVRRYNVYAAGVVEAIAISSEILPNHTRKANAVYIAAFDPEVTLGLLDKLERYGEALKRWAENNPGDSAFGIHAALNPTEANDES